MSCDNFVAEFLSLQEKVPQQNAFQEKSLSKANTDKMLIQGDVDLRSLYSDPTEQFMEEYVGTSRKMKGLFKARDTSAVKENLQQIICAQHS